MVERLRCEPHEGSSGSSFGPQLYRYDRDELYALRGASDRTPVDPRLTDIRNNFSLLERAVTQFDARFTLRALRSISSLRKRFNGEVICEAIISTYPPNNPTARTLIRATRVGDAALSQIAKRVTSESSGSKQEKKEPIPEIDVYIAILVQVSYEISVNSTPG